MQDALKAGDVRPSPLYFLSLCPIVVLLRAKNTCAVCGASGVVVRLILLLWQ